MLANIFVNLKSLPPGGFLTPEHVHQKLRPKKHKRLNRLKLDTFDTHMLAFPLLLFLPYPTV
jgi:hypothetical protein